jgi:hypothetical protein
LEEPGHTEEVLGTQVLVETGLDHQDGIDDDVTESHGETGNEEKKDYHQHIAVVIQVQTQHGSELYEPKEDEVGLPLESTASHIVTDDSIDNLEAPWQSHDTRVYRHISRFLIHVGLE